MFLKRAKTLIGLDIGTRAIKAVELTWNDGPVITGFGYAEVSSPEAVPETVGRVLRENAFHTRRVVTSVSGKAVIVRYLTMFKMGAEDLKNAIKFEADKYIPFGVDDVVMDCQPFTVEGLGDIAPNEMRVLLVACKRAIIDEQLRILSSVNLQPEVIDVDVFAIGNAFATAVRRGPEAQGRVTALVDVGASKTSVNVMRGNSSLFTREIHAAGDAFTAAIASRLNLKQAEAEALKQQPGAEQEHMRAAVAPAVEDLSNEVRLSFDYFENQFDRAIDEVLLSGGGARLLGLPQDLARALGKPATTWDPTGDLPIAAGAVDVDILRGRVTDLAVAVGLASRVQP